MHETREGETKVNFTSYSENAQITRRSRSKEQHSNTRVKRGTTNCTMPSQLLQEATTYLRIYAIAPFKRFLGIRDDDTEAKKRHTEKHLSENRRPGKSLRKHPFCLSSVHRRSQGGMVAPNF